MVEGGVGVRHNIILCNAMTDQVSFDTAAEMFEAIQREEIACRNCKNVGRGDCPVHFVDVSFLCNQWVDRKGEI